ncbi:MAG: hypothetical protein AB7O96_01810 [Pseudobdellovibrionaceae bacterium]
MKFICLLFLETLCFTQIATAQSSWSEYQRSYLLQVAENKKKGMSYLVSGIVVTGIGLVAYNSSPDPLARGFCVFAQAIGVAAAGRGASLYFGGSESQSFYEALNESRTLTDFQRSELVRIYTASEDARIEQEEKIRAWTYATIAALTIYGASQEPDPNLRTGLFVLGAANLALSLSFAF